MARDVRVELANRALEKARQSARSPYYKRMQARKEQLRKELARLGVELDQVDVRDGLLVVTYKLAEVFEL